MIPGVTAGARRDAPIDASPLLVGSYSPGPLEELVDAHLAFATLTGHNGLVAMHYLEQSRPYSALLGDATAMIDAWSAWLQADPLRQFVLSVPALQSETARQWTNTAGDATHVAIAEMIEARALSAQVVYRFGWEPNSVFGWSWQPSADTSSALDAASSGFKTLWQRLRPQVRAVAPGLRWDFCPVAWDPVGHAHDPTEWYPGDEHVDTVSMDFYDRYWGSPSDPPSARWQNHLRWHHERHVEFAVAHGKPAGLGEWGLWTTADGTGGGDNSYYIERIADLVNDPANGFERAIYFNDEGGGVGLTLAECPEALAAYRQRFGQGG